MTSQNHITANQMRYDDLMIDAARARLVADARRSARSARQANPHSFTSMGTHAACRALAALPFRRFSITRT